jgi:hypothetical protein
VIESADSTDSFHGQEYHVIISPWPTEESGEGTGSRRPTIGKVFPLRHLRANLHGGRVPHKQYHVKDGPMYLQTSMIDSCGAFISGINVPKSEFSKLGTSYTRTSFQRGQETIQAVLMKHHSLVLDRTGATYYSVLPQTLEGIQVWTGDVIDSYWSPEVKITEVRRANPLERPLRLRQASQQDGSSAERRPTGNP